MSGELSTYSPDQEVTSCKGLVEEIRQCAVLVGAEADFPGGPRPESLRLMKCVICENFAVLLSRKRQWKYERLFGKPVVLSGGYAVGKTDDRAYLMQGDVPVVSVEV